MTLEKPTLYIDMDGTIADFYAAPRAVERFDKERYFFDHLKPLPKNLQAVRNAIAHGYNVYVLTASPHDVADRAKMRWIRAHLPELPESHLLIVRLGANKAEIMPTAHGVLFDDYGKNCREWVATRPQNRAVKVREDGDIEQGIRAMYVLHEQILNA